MTAIVSILLSLLGQIAPAATGNATLIGTIIEALTQLVPLLVKEYKDLLPIVKDIIATLKGDPTVTADQLATLDALDAQTDAEFDAAAAAATAEDAAGQS